MPSHPTSSTPHGPGRRRRPGDDGDALGHGGGAGYGAYGGDAPQADGGYDGYDDFRAPFGAGAGAGRAEPYTVASFDANANASASAKAGATASAGAGARALGEPAEAHGYPHRDGNADGAGPRIGRASARAAARARSRRKRRVRNGVLGVGSVAALSVLAVAGLLPDHGSTPATSADGISAVTAKSSGPSGSASASAKPPAPKPAPGFAQLPGLGASFRAKIPAGTGQVLLARGASATTNTVTVVLYTRTAAGTWLPGATWSGHNALDGWTTDHHDGDLHSPIGAFTLTDAGGLYANPGTKLPYLQSSEFKDLSTGFEGESLADAFDYVVAINYNHVPGTSPLSPQRPMGESKGGGIWVHVDHGGPTHGCISIPQVDMVALLKALDPAKHPVIVMGDAAALAA
jgi:L,D-peptidoglycan transpeptidase YkuD (ErfK/YbiS/YcfS/YnhG family)